MKKPIQGTFTLKEALIKQFSTIINQVVDIKLL